MDTQFKDVLSIILSTPLYPSQDELLWGYLLNQSDLNISWNDFSVVFWISVKICINVCHRAEVDQQEKRLHF